MNLISADMHACNYLLQQVFTFSVNTYLRFTDPVCSDLTDGDEELGNSKC